MRSSALTSLSTLGFTSCRVISAISEHDLADLAADALDPVWATG